MNENKEYCKRIADALDYDFRMSSTFDLLSLRVWVALGGPNVWIDTERRAVASRGVTVSPGNFG